MSLDAKVRSMMSKVLNEAEAARAELEKDWGQVWNTEELQKDFTVESFLAPFVMVTRKEDGKRGSLMFQHSPRFYFCFKEA